MDRDFQFILNEVNSYKEINTPQKTCLLKRLFLRKLSVDKLHPNPEDEFCDKDIGPSKAIIKSYEDYFRLADRKDEKRIQERLVVEKMSTGGYMILNGHHRWMAAKHAGMKNVPVQIVNVTPVEEIISKMNQSRHWMCASFDFDEVLMTDGERCPIDKKFPFPFDRIFKESLRNNAPLLIKELQNRGFDVWVYTGDYYSEFKMKLLFRIHHVKVDGIINGKRAKQVKDTLRKAFMEKYKLSLHIDNDAMICVDTKTKEYEIYNVNPEGMAWSSEMFAQLKSLTLPEAD